jgi:hypothetical protein
LKIQEKSLRHMNHDAWKYVKQSNECELNEAKNLLCVCLIPAFYNVKRAFASIFYAAYLVIIAEAIPGDIPDAQSS